MQITGKNGLGKILRIVLIVGFFLSIPMINLSQWIINVRNNLRVYKTIQIFRR